MKRYTYFEDGRVKHSLIAILQGETKQERNEEIEHAINVFGFDEEGTWCQHSHDCCGRWYEHPLDIRVRKNVLRLTKEEYQNI